jgi:CheY-like chemotaxis protein/anti-sigma regulatory factor (Ser/Thr protein kinase)
VFDLSDVAGQAVDVSKSWLTAAEKEGRRVSLYTRLKEGCLVNGDQDVIFGAIINLVRNALEALPTGGDVDLTTTVEGNKVVLRVKDTGIGINRENLARVFNPFFTTKAEAGAGLSLASTRKIVENFGGRILVDSVEGQGTTFTLLFPLAERLPEPTKALHDLEPAERLTIMVIDDMVELTDLMKSALTAYGHAVLTANSGEEAIEIFQDNPADVVICDLGMPGMTGWDVGRCVTAICHERGAPKPPFVLLTAWANQEVETEKIARSGVDAVIGKPLNIRIILEVIREVVEKSHSAVSNE